MLTSPLILDSCNQDDLREYFQNSWAREETLLHSIINHETFEMSPDPLRNRLVFYLGHSAVFYINKLISVGLLKHRINDFYETLFEIGVDPETPEELEQAVSTIRWPDVTKVWQYRDAAKDEITRVINQTEISLPIKQNDPLWALLMAIEHSLIHFETSSMLIRQLPPDKVTCPQGWSYAASRGNPPANEFREIPGGIVNLGKSVNSSTYGWDSDYGNLTVEVKPFFVSKYLVSNQEFLEFVQDNGYENPQYWDSKSWNWKQQYDVQHPKFWLATNNGYRYRAVFDEIDFPADFPVEVNHYEAMAYCRWQGAGNRLLTEAEWNLVTGKSQDQGLDNLANNDAAFNTKNYNLNVKYCSPSPLGMADSSNNKFGVYDLRGNVWEWLGDKFNCLPGFKAHHLYQDFSAPFCDHKHYLMVGGSWASMGAYASAFYRNWFRPYFYQHVGFRLAKSID